MELWDRVLASIRERISDQNFDIWFKPTIAKEHDEGRKVLCVQVPSQHFKYWLTHHYSDVIEAALAAAGIADYQLVFSADESEAPPAGSPPPSGKGTYAAAAKGDDCRLNPKYTFNGFVVGGCNQFAHAASVAVAEQPATAYNPLFIYGGVGLGKTHLMHAIGHSIKMRSPRLRLTYMSSERFMNELINAIRYDTTMQFRSKYRNIDVLLMDDIQFLAGKERTQEEFFHTFNALYDSQKQIVISSDSPPREIPSLEERLHSRFEWGLIADMQAPDLETKVAILCKKADIERVRLPEDVAMFIASNTKSNVRELEGALIRLIAYSSLTGEDISPDLATKVLKPLADKAVRVITIDAIQSVVAEHFSLRPSDLKARNNSRRMTGPRQIAMYLCKQLTDHSLPQIGREFGGKHHTTVLHAVRKITRLRREDAKMERTLNQLQELI